MRFLKAPPAWARQRLGKGVIRALLGLAVVGLAGSEWLHGGSLAASSAYGFCVLLAGWHEGVGAVVFLAVLGLLADHLRDGFATFDALNEPIRMAFWVAAGAVAANLRAAREESERQRKALRQVFEEMRGDLDAAELVQTSLLERPRPSDPRLDLVIHHATSRVLGGDYFEVLPSKDRVLLCIADVSGKGPPAAMVTTYFRGLLEEVATRDPAPGRVLQQLNRQLVPSLPDTMFLTCFYGVLDLHEGVLQYASAGHDPPFLLRAATGAVSDLPATGLPLGILPNEVFREATVSLAPGDRLLLFTDGLTAVRNEEGRRLQEEDVVGALLAGRAGDNTQMLDRLLALSPALRQGDLEDDVVLILLTVPERQV